MEEITISEMVQQLFKMKETYKTEVERVLPIQVGNAALNLFVSNFDKEGFDTGHGVDKWQEVKRRIPDTPEYKYPKGRQLSRHLSGILIRTGRGRRAVINSLRSPRVVPGMIVIPFEVASDYMGYHNEGNEQDGGHLPKREFMGNSDALNEIFNTKVKESFNRIENAN